jgi:quinol-cytochrome oxidoreductase complex cytochrome b subunit
MERTEDQESPNLVSRETLVRYEVVAILAVSVALMGWSLLSPAPLGEPADPATTPAVVSAPWIFAWVQELLRHLPPLIAGILVPVVLFAILSLIPFLPPQTDAEGEASPGTQTLAPLVLLLILGGVAAITLLHLLR